MAVDIDLFLNGTVVLTPQLRMYLILITVCLSALVFCEDFRYLKVPDKVFWFCLIPITLFWTYTLTGQDFSGIGWPNVIFEFILPFIGIGFVLLIILSLFALPLYGIGYLFNIGEADTVYAGLLALLLPSPAVWGSPLPHISHTFNIVIVDFLINTAFVFVIAGVIAKIYTHLRGGFGFVPFTPVVALIFVTTVLFGAWWRPVLMPLIHLII